MALMCALTFSEGSEWKRIRSAGNKQILPQRVAKFISPLNEIADDLMEQLWKCRDDDGNIEDIRDFTVKWSFQGVHYILCVCVCVCGITSPNMS